MKFLLVLLLLFLSGCNAESTKTEVKKDIFKEGTYTYSTNGEYGPMDVEIVIEDDRVSKIDIVSCNDSKAMVDDVVNLYIQPIIKTQDYEIDMVSGATGTCRGVKLALKQCIKEARIQNEQEN